MKKQIIIALKMLGLMTVLLGIIYPLLITGIAQLVFPIKANGSLVEVNGMLKGSELIGQKNNSNIYFNTRPSATNYASSGASNLGPSSKKLYEEMVVRKANFIVHNELNINTTVPEEMLFASASGLDPHISPEAAKMQIDRIAKERKFSNIQKEELKKLVDNSIEAPQFGVLGCYRVNVFMLNLALDKLK